MRSRGIARTDTSIILIEITNIFKTIFRESDIVARIGGDEFVIIMPETGQAEAMKVLERFKQKNDIGQADTLPSLTTATRKESER